jgi:hypothetical protein
VRTGHNVRNATPGKGGLQQLQRGVSDIITLRLQNVMVPTFSVCPQRILR